MRRPVESGDGTKRDYERENTISPGDVYPYSLKRLNVDKAWKRSTGEGITIGVVDTGISAHQPQFHEQWDDGQSSGRTITRTFSDRNDRWFSPADYHDSCGHGSRILGLIAAPRDGRNAVGFAYRSNVIAVRALPDPSEYIGWGSWDEMRNGINIAAAGSKIINMSFGSPTGNTSVVNAINNWYDRDGVDGRLFFGAVGTGADSETSVFPASLPNVNAVTGLDPVTSSYPNYNPCGICFRGDDVEFGAWDNVATTWTDENELARIGGSSGGSAQITAIAALVWSRYPSWTRDQVLARLRQAAPLSQKRNGTGYGPPDAWLAVGGVTDANISGPDHVQIGPDSAVFEAFAVSLDSPSPGRYNYYWSTGSSSKTIMPYHSCEDVGTTQSVSVTITDPSDGTVYYQTKSYTVHDDAGTCSTGGGGGGVCQDKPNNPGCEGTIPDL